IIISGNGFYCVDKIWFDQLSCDRNNICAAYFLQNFEANVTHQGFQLLLGTRVLTMPLLFALDVNKMERFPDVTFCIRTSGSTGKPKTVLVPRACIMPNVLSLSKRFALCERDIIFVCSPPTFDPFVVDIFMGLRSGAALLLVDNSIRLSAKRLLGILFPGVTVMQITPSMFTRWNKNDMEHVIFHPNTTLKTLVLGGEHFPILQRPKNCPVNMYNIYGITEVSCWSMMQKVPNDNQVDVPLGETLDESIVLQIRNATDESLSPEHLANGSVLGQLYIGSCSRKCVILEQSNNDHEEAFPLFRATGDLVERTAEGKYYYRGRCCRTIKRFGCRVNLTELETILQTHPSVEQCAACLIDEQQSLVMFFKSVTDNSSVRGSLWTDMRAKLRTEQLPDEIHHIDQFPLSAHGKTCPEGLRSLYKHIKKSLVEDCISPKDFFRAKLEAMGILYERHPVKSNSKKKEKPNSSFVDHGGTSFGALCLHAALEERFGIQLPGLIALLLDPSTPLEQAMRYIESKTSPLKGSLQRNEGTNEVYNEKLLSIEHRYDLKKCIDSRASIVHLQDIGSILSVGSHSGMLLTINIDTNAVVSRIFLPDRIECTVSFFMLQTTVYGIVGCYDGFLYCFNPLKDESIHWKYDAGGMIKCTPLVVPQSNLIIFGSYSSSHNLHCIKGVSYNKTNRTKPILSQPVVLGDEKAENVLIATLDGTIAVVSIVTGCLVWKRATERQIPIFGTPTFLPECKSAALCSVDGTLEIYDTIGGSKRANHSFPGNVFCSCLALKHPEEDRVDFIVGCYDRHVYCVEYLPKNRETLEVKWKIEQQSQIYATPALIGYHLIVCTSSGWLNLFDTRSVGSIQTSLIAKIKVNG
uniref:Uncharacterized protein n=1 Tax=Anopheles epiroticus TaxID=199890 RepID=A0A182PVP6_9DIPT